MPTDLLSTAAVAALLGVSRQTVSRWIREKKLKAIRIKVADRAIYRIRPSDLRDFVRRYVSGDW